MMIDKKEAALELRFYFLSSGEIDPEIREKLLLFLNDTLEEMDEEKEVIDRKHKSPNKSGIVQIDAKTGRIVAEYATQAEAAKAIGKDYIRSPLSDALHNRVKGRKSYGYVWAFKDQLNDVLQEVFGTTQTAQTSRSGRTGKRSLRIC